MTELTQPMPEIELTDADRQKIQETAAKIDLTDSSLCLIYGSAGQKKLADVSDKLLKMTRNDDSAAVGERISDLVKELRKCSDTKLQSGLFGWLFRRRERRNLRKQCETAVQNADRIAEELEIHRNRLLRDFVMLDKLYDSVLEQYRELTVLTEAGQRKLEEDTSADKDLRERFRKRLHDLKLSRTVCMQTMTQIRILQGCNTALSEKIQSLLTNTVALWKNQTALALAMKNTGQTMETLRDANREMIGVLEEVCTAEDNALSEADILQDMIESKIRDKELNHA